MVIQEPCNYASNLAYAHVATEMCGRVGTLSMAKDSSTAIIQTVCTFSRGEPDMSIGAKFPFASQKVTNLGGTEPAKLLSPLLLSILNSNRMSAQQVAQSVTLESDFGHFRPEKSSLGIFIY